MGRTERIEALLALDCEQVNVQDSGGNTPLHLSLWNNKPRAAEMLVAAGANVKAQNRRGETPFMLAANMPGGEERNQLVSLLLTKGADCDLFSAISLARHDLIDACLRSDPDALERPNRRGRTPLRIAAESGLFYGAANHRAVAEDLISRGATIDIWSASSLGRPDLVATHLQANPALLNAYDNTFTPLHCAAKGGHLPVVETLVNHGAALDPVANDLMTPMILALWSDRKETARYLASRGANVNALDNWSREPWIEKALL